MPKHIAQHINKNQCLVKTYSMGFLGTSNKYWLVIAPGAEQARAIFARETGVATNSAYIRFYTPKEHEFNHGLPQAII